MIAFAIYLKNFKTKMTCTYSRKTQTTYTEVQLQLAVEHIKKGEISLSKSSEAYNIPKATLHKRVHNKVQSHGRGTATLIQRFNLFLI